MRPSALLYTSAVQDAVSEWSCIVLLTRWLTKQHSLDVGALGKAGTRNGAGGVVASGLDGG